MNFPEPVRRVEDARRLRVCCLGRFRLEDDRSQPVHLRTRKARAALAFLALSAKPVSREQLASLLWSERGEEQARASVRQTIFELRHSANGGQALVCTGADEHLLEAHHLVTDLSLIRSAAEADDYGRLHDLLAGSEAGLLTDLDGLDSEFDGWLRGQRAREPTATLALATEAAERCLQHDGANSARPIAAEILRLDPSNEAAVRLTMRIDQETGDSAALHRRFEALQHHLREEYGAHPSPETVELFERLKDAPPSSRAEAAVPALKPAADAPARNRHWAAATALLAIIVAAIALAVWAARPELGVADEPLLAVLPFEQQPAGDRFLAEGLWEDTRTALSRNPALRVLGRATTAGMAERKLAPSEYRRRLGVDYVLEGSVRRLGEQVRVTVGLTRTSDGVAVWNGAFRGRLGDALALQEAIATAIEGRIRGRLARGGGTRAEHIATSPEVYSLYSEARALLRDRQRENGGAAERLLRRALASDPNFAPAWSSLASALYFSPSDPARITERRAMMRSYVQRALALAPNLAEANATVALVSGDASDESRLALERAVRLDPGYAEAWLWLGNARNRLFRTREAAAAYRNAVDIDPLWFPAVHNLASTLIELGDRPAVNRLLATIRKAGADEEMLVTTRAEIALLEGDYSAAVKSLLRLRSAAQGARVKFVQSGLAEGLLRLGYAEEAGSLLGLPDSLGPMLRSERGPPDRFGSEGIGDDDFWRAQFLANYGSRALLNLGRERDLVERYRAAFDNSDEFLLNVTEHGTFEAVSINLAIALDRTGDKAEAEYLLASTARPFERAISQGLDHRDLWWLLARVRAVQGRRGEALGYLTRAIGRGWLPNGLSAPLDIAQEPAFRELRGDARFEATRKSVLDHIARERAELGPVSI